MTVIVNTIWGGRVCQVVDRQITRRASATGEIEVLDTASTKICIALCSNALVSIAYTGVAIAHLEWMDSVLASCLAHRNLATAMIQPGAPWLARPIHAVVHELSVNLNGRLNSDARARGTDLWVSIVGWHLGRRQRPLAWELTRDNPDPNGMRYFRLTQHKVGKFLRQCPTGLWAESLGDIGTTVDSRLQGLGETRGFTHDDVELYVKEAIAARSAETATVGAECLAVQLDPDDAGGQVQFTYYPGPNAVNAPTFLTGWVLTPTIACSPGEESISGSTFSECGKYIVGGFTDCGPSLNVRTRLPSACAHHGEPVVMSYGTQARAPVS